MAPWTETQKKRLVSQIRIWGNQWDKIADHPELQGRSGKACKQRACDATSGIQDAVAAIPPVDDLRAAGVTLGSRNPAQRPGQPGVRRMDGGAR